MKKFFLFACIGFLMFSCSKPEADFSFTTMGNEVMCTASTSTADSYSWTWGDNTSRSYGFMVSHTYAKTGDYTITLSVDDNGNFAEKSKRVHISSTIGGGGSTGDMDSYKAFKCKSIRVNKMPLRDGSSRWDVNSDADLFFKIFKGDSKIYECSNYIQNVSSLPVTKTLSQEVTFYKDISSYKVQLLDYDDLSSNDLIGSVPFSGSSLFKNGLATSVTLTNSSGTISIDLIGYMD